MPIPAPMLTAPLIVLTVCAVLMMVLCPGSYAGQMHTRDGCMRMMYAFILAPCDSRHTGAAQGFLGICLGPDLLWKPWVCWLQL